jgi:S-adenosylmethionine:tRNA ribosyltransferase-isomerase
VTPVPWKRAGFVFHFTLLPHLIAQYPSDCRDQSRLLVVRRQTNTLAHCRFADLPTLLAPGDLLVLNNTRVVPARLLGVRQQTGGKWEGLFLREHEDGTWEMLCQSRGKLHEGETIFVEPGPLALTLVEKRGQGAWRVRPGESGPAVTVLARYGRMPLPGYIRKGMAEDIDRDRYQTVFAERDGAVAAPTAGLHFTPEVLDAINKRGIAVATVTLHVGWGTFQPIKVEDYTQHQMHSEWGELPAETVAAVAACRQRGGKVVAVGTTAVRVLETVAAQGQLAPWTGETNLFIYPPYPFRVVDALVTNFHLPGTTLLLLVGAFAGEDLLAKAYQTAIAEGYRFYSYGDAMLVL